MTRTTKFLAGASLALALGAVGQIGVYQQAAPSGATMHASWIFQPASVKQLQARAQTIALVRVVATRPGPDIVTKQSGEPSGEDRIPTQRVTVEVVKPFKGTASAGARLTLFQTGGTVNLPPAPAKGEKGEAAPEVKVHQVILEGDPLYRAGEQYLVMLEAGPQGTMRTVSPEGRYRYDAASGDLSPMVENAVTRQVGGQSLKALAPLLQGEAS